MRLRFESKLNHLHSLYRDIETRYERACEDIDQLQTNNNALITLADKQRSEITELSTKKVKLETDTEFKDSQIKFHIRELDSKQRKIIENEYQLSKLQTQCDRLKFQVNDLNEQINSFEVQKDVTNTTVESLKHERSLLEQALRDIKEERDKYFNLHSQEKDKFIEINEKLQALQREEMSYQKISKNFDQRVTEMDQNNIELQGKLEKAEKEVAVLTEKNEILNSNNESLSIRVKEISSEIENMNSAKNKFSTDLDNAREQISILNQQMSQKDEIMETDKKELERLSRRLIDMEQENDSLEIEKNAHQKTNFVQK